MDGNFMDSNLMIPIGYLYKKVSLKPDWLSADCVEDIYSLSACVSDYFMDDWINQWKHNGYWLYNSPQDIHNIAKENNISLEGMTLFFYSSYQYQWEEYDKQWVSYEPEGSFETNILMPEQSTLQGYDVATFFSQASAECSPLSCNHMASEILVNSHCLFDSFDKAKDSLVAGLFDGCEPGPFRIIAVYKVEL